MNPYPLEIVSDQKGNLIRIVLNNGETWLRLGECTRCIPGCCERCQYLEFETLNGIKVSKCKIEFNKPWRCKQYPNNPYDYDPKLVNCGYYWEKVNG